MKERGFSLIEALVALTIVAVAGLALTHVSGESLRNAAALEARILARIVARNTLIEAVNAPVLPSSGASGRTALAGRNWQWTVSVSSEAPTLARITVVVQPWSKTRPSGSAISLTGWRREGTS